VTALLVAPKRAGGGGEAEIVQVVEKSFDASCSGCSGFSYCVADSNDAICHVTAGQWMFEIAHQASLIAGLPAAEGVFVDFHVDALAAKFYALDVEAEALFGCGFAS